jgi:outer membrane protein assembly factor BamB
MALMAGSSVLAQETWPMAGHDAAHSGTVDGPEPPYRVAWELEGPDAPVTGAAATDQAVIVLSSEGVLALDPADGTVIWERGRPSGPAGVPAIAGDLVIHARDDGVSGQVVARDLATGDIVWQANIGAAAAGGPTVAGEMVIVGTLGGEVIALDLATGKERWRFETLGGVAGAPAVADGVVVAAAYQGTTGRSTVYALDAAAGTEDRKIWQFDAGPVGPPSGPAIGDGLAYVGLSDLEIRAFDLGDGAERWTFSSRDGFGPRQIPAAGRALIAADRTHLYRLDPATGDERWSWLLADLTAVSQSRVDTLLASAPSVSGSSALLGSASGELSAIDIDSGRRVWRSDLGEGIGPIAVTTDRVYAVVLGDGGRLVALEHDPEGEVIDEISPTVLFVADGMVNFALAAAAVGVGIWLLFRFALRPRRVEEAS